ncbi:uncharacterized protein LOC142787048 isoform X2 [Rhipicephalus microplus]|uniref:uncharacterized protein LOC142787048 isoform X2 n=1 Tax=Rhipicephalus microplus TaxID=6941 RepID=UPI003F6A664D
MGPANFESKMKTSIQFFNALTIFVFMWGLHFGHSGSSDSKSQRKDEDITRFYCTNATIMTLFTTVSPQECKTDRVNKTSNESTEFQRTFNSSNMKTLNLRGTFTNARKSVKYETYDAMDVTEMEGNWYHKFEELLFTFDSDNCGIFFVAPWGRRGTFLLDTHPYSPHWWDYPNS